MNFNISTIIFILVSVLIFFAVPKAAKKPVMLGLSLVFCFFLDPAALLMLVFVTLITYITGLFLERSSDEGTKKYVFTAILSLFILNLLFWKGHPLINISGQNLLLPVGISFYSFQAISYLSDIMKGKQKAEKNLISFAIYMTWFPKLISGPIERAGTFLPELESTSVTKLFDENRIIRALSYILWGLFMKLMIADRAGLMVNAFFEDPKSFPAIYLLAGSLLYTLQIYCDFAGYTNIMIGISELFGIRLTQNFKTPYFSENISDFWKRWHITLSSFLRDYIYIPLGGNRRGKVRKYLNILAVFIISGIWHGKGTGFVIWGLIHGISSVLEGLVRDTKLSFLIRGITGRIVTFCIVSFAWIFFRAGTFGDSMTYISCMFTSRGNEQGLLKLSTEPCFSGIQTVILLTVTAILFIADLISCRKETLVPEIIINTGEIRRDTAFLLLAVTVLIFGVYGDSTIGTFIYMNF